MAIKKVVIKFIDDYGEFEEEETYLVDNNQSEKEGYISQGAHILEVIENLEPNLIGMLKNGENFLLVDKVEEYSYKELIERKNELYHMPNNKLYNIANDLPTIITNAVHISEDISEVIKVVIDVKLTKDNLDNCITILKNMPKMEYVKDMISQLENIKIKQGKLEIHEIKNVFLLNEIAGIYKNMELYKKAKKVLQSSLSINRKNHYTLTRIGTITRYLKQYDASLNYFNDSLEIKKTSYAYIGLAALYREINNLPAAKYNYLQSFKYENNLQHTHAHRGLGSVYYDMSLYEEGNKHYRLANVGTSYLYKIFNDAMDGNETRKAIEILRLILQINPNDNFADNRLKDLE